MTNILLDGIKHTYWKLVYSHKTHEKAAENETKISFRVNIINIALLSSVVLLWVAQLVITNRFFQIISWIISFLALLIGVYMYAYNHEKKSEWHKTTAKQLLQMREKYMYFVNDIEAWLYTDIQELKLQRDILWNDLSKIYELAPQTSEENYNNAKDKIQNNEEHTFNPWEVDNLL